MKKKILLIIALIMIISTILRTMIVGYSFLNFSNATIENEANLLKELLQEVIDKDRFIKIIQKSQHIKEIEFINKKSSKTTILSDYNHKTFTTLLPFSDNQTLKIVFEADNYFKKLQNTYLQLIFIAIVSLIIIILIVNYFLTPYLEILEKIKTSTNNILNGNFNQHIDTKLKGEAKEFVDSFNIFLQKLKESFGVIEEKYTSLIEKERSDDPLNDAKETIEQLANIFKFKNMIEEDNTTDEIFNRLVDVLLNFKINNFSLIGIDNSENTTFEIYKQGDICCDILDNFKACRAYRLKKTINSQEFPKVCPMHYCDNEYICIPFSASGNFTGILKININSEAEKKHINKNLPYIKAYLNEVSAIIEAKYTLELLHNQSIKDPLTNLFNRRHLENILPMLIAAAQRRNEKLAFLMIDMDYFKTVNDTYGHKAGDTVLKTLANILINNVRKSDIVIRYGGEEFLIILQNIKSYEDAINIAEKIRTSIENTKIQLDNTVIQKTISIGISLFPEHCKQGWECIKYADIALYKAKENGRNQVVLFHEDFKKDYEEY
ncbi:ggdef domain protein [Nautilia profundicola AmH]|uniref:diguanylate cyclase n=1 Tax=Nautilia profundicola (strain ATCC BAA-1463 / DSM 18972 / AmH) TaxID=598659 RepID=B9L5N3_NAUPA|nr:GGDEF domain-containing protein [Nautilia profundicola]ACM92233.1 ggdef domain protein [Nautilia profundicola AmH]